VLFLYDFESGSEVIVLGRHKFLMKKAELTYISILVFNVTCAWGDDLPTRFNFDRYKTMLEHSPFAVASAVVAPTATPNFAKDLYVANAARSSDGDVVTIASSTDKDFKKYLITKNPVDGYSIASIEWSDKVGETKVTISKDGQLATLTFNQVLLVQPLPNRPPGVSSSGFQRVVALPTPAPPARGVIRQNPQGQIPSSPSEN
jgi:hypothetical protein